MIGVEHWNDGIFSVAMLSEVKKMQ